jgi:hypothetical protein
VKRVSQTSDPLHQVAPRHHAIDAGPEGMHEELRALESYRRSIALNAATSFCSQNEEQLTQVARQYERITPRHADFDGGVRASHHVDASGPGGTPARPRAEA